MERLIKPKVLKLFFQILVNLSFTAAFIQQKHGIKKHCENFKQFLYSNWMFISAAISLAAVMAHGSFDARLRRWWLTHLQPKNFIQKLMTIAKPAGEWGGTYIPTMMLAVFFLENKLTRRLFKLPFIRKGVLKTFKQFIQGILLQSFLTVLLGGSRPERRSSRWFQGGWFETHPQWYTASGHAFYGAFPWLMLINSSPSKKWQSIFMGLSTLPGLSRIHTDHHYASQVFLGWACAYVTSQKSVDFPEKNSSIALPILPPTPELARDKRRQTVDQTTRNILPILPPTPVLVRGKRRQTVDQTTGNIPILPSTPVILPPAPVLVRYDLLQTFKQTGNIKPRLPVTTQLKESASGVASQNFIYKPRNWIPTQNHGQVAKPLVALLTAERAKTTERKKEH